MSDFNEKYSEYLSLANVKIEEFISKLDLRPKILNDSVAYSVMLGGKRIRPVLMYAMADLLGVERQKIENYALALELIHTYSLIHDDLPEMDNAEYRRGKLANHKVFGVGNAVLAGDGLLNTAYSILFGECHLGREFISAAEYVCSAAGVYGMIAGQSADLLNENNTEYNEPTLEFIYKNKTGKLINAALVVPSILCGGKYFTELNHFANDLGYLFQITDDILDVMSNLSTLGKDVKHDENEGKYTAVSLYGLEGSCLKADVLMDRCLKVLDKFDGDTSFFKDLVAFVRERKN